MHVLNAALTGFFNLVFFPFRRLDPMWGLAFVSLVTGVVMLWIFGRLSDQDTIHKVRDRIRGNLLGVRIFGDDIGLLFRLQGSILKDTLRYLRYAFAPMLVMMIPVILILIQMNLWFEARPLHPGERTTVKAVLRDEASAKAGVTLEVPPGLIVETPGVVVPELGEVVWRVRAEKPGRYDLMVRTPGTSVTKEIVVGKEWGPVSPLRSGRSIWEMLLYPGEHPIKKSEMVRAIEVAYPELPLEAFGFGIDWMIFFFIASIVFGFLFKKPLGVEI